MKKDINKEMNEDENKINEGIVGLEENIQNNKRTRYIIYGVVTIALAVLFGVLAGTGVI